MPRKINEVGNRYGKLVVLGEAHTHLDKNRWLRCQCDCGNKKNIRADALRRGATKSCGCLRKEEASNRAKGKKQPPRHVRSCKQRGQNRRRTNATAKRNS